MCVCLCSVVSDYCFPMGCSPPGYSVHGIPRQEYWSRSQFPPPGDLPDPGMEPWFSCISCIGRRNLFRWVIWEAPHSPGFWFNWYKVRPEDKEGLKPTQDYSSTLPGWQTIEYNFYYQTKVLIVIYQERDSIFGDLYCKICIMKNVFIF